jgi:hypothetical protein
MRSTYTHAQRAGIPNSRVTTPHDHELRFSYCSECPNFPPVAAAALVAGKAGRNRAAGASPAYRALTPVASINARQEPSGQDFCLPLLNGAVKLSRSANS